MNRLEQMIHRLTAQRNCLDLAARLIEDLPGPVLEFGLGKGRTYDYLRHRLPERRIVAFDREVHCPPDCVPAPGDLMLGEFRDTIPGALGGIGEAAALAHFDIGSEDPGADDRLAAWLAPAAAPLIRPRGVIVSDRAMSAPGWIDVPLPDGARSEGHFVYRNEPDGTDP